MTTYILIGVALWLAFGAVRSLISLYGNRHSLAVYAINECAEAYYAGVLPGDYFLLLGWTLFKGVLLSAVFGPFQQPLMGWYTRGIEPPEEL